MALGGPKKVQNLELHASRMTVRRMMNTADRAAIDNDQIQCRAKANVSLVAGISGLSIPVGSKQTRQAKTHSAFSILRAAFTPVSAIAYSAVCGTGHSMASECRAVVSEVIAREQARGLNDAFKHGHRCPWAILTKMHDASKQEMVVPEDMLVYITGAHITERSTSVLHLFLQEDSLITPTIREKLLHNPLVMCTETSESIFAATSMGHAVSARRTIETALLDGRLGMALVIDSCDSGAPNMKHFRYVAAEVSAFDALFSGVEADPNNLFFFVRRRPMRTFIRISQRNARFSYYTYPIELCKNFNSIKNQPKTDFAKVEMLKSLRRTGRAALSGVNLLCFCGKRDAMGISTQPSELVRCRLNVRSARSGRACD